METLRQDYEIFIEQKIQAGEFTSRAEILEAALDDMIVKEMMTSPSTKQLLEERLSQPDSGEIFELNDKNINELRTRLHNIIHERAARTGL